MQERPCQKNQSHLCKSTLMVNNQNSKKQSLPGDTVDSQNQPIQLLMMEPSANALAIVPQLDVHANKSTGAGRKNLNVKYRSVQTGVLNKNIA